MTKDSEHWARFRAAYLLVGSAESANAEIGKPISDSKAREWARQLNRDPDFRAEKLEICDEYLDELIHARQRIARIALKRAGAEDADIYSQEVVIDNRVAWAKVVLDAEKNAHNLAKYTRDMAGPAVPSGPAIVINLSGEATVSEPGK